LNKIYHLKIYKNNTKINKTINKKDRIIHIKENSKIIKNNKMLGIRTKPIIKMVNGNDNDNDGFCYDI
jgi:hypothetical protein